MTGLNSQYLHVFKNILFPHVTFRGIHLTMKISMGHIELKTNTNTPQRGGIDVGLLSAALFVTNCNMQ